MHLKTFAVLLCVAVAVVTGRTFEKRDAGADIPTINCDTFGLRLRMEAANIPYRCRTEEHSLTSRSTRKTCGKPNTAPGRENPCEPGCYYQDEVHVCRACKESDVNIESCKQNRKKSQ